MSRWWAQARKRVPAAAVGALVLFVLGLVLVWRGGDTSLAVGTAFLTGAVLSLVVVAAESRLEDHRIRGLYQVSLGLADSLEGRALAGLDLRRIQLPSRRMANVNLRMAHLEDANLQRAYLQEANLSMTHMEGAVLEWAHLEGAHLQGAHLEGAHLEGTYLELANLKGAHLEGAFLEGAHLEGVRYDKSTRWPSGFTPSSKAADPSPDPPTV